jgi:hypothetical protein
MTTEQIYETVYEGANHGIINLPEQHADPAIILRALRDHAKDIADWMGKVIYTARLEKGGNVGIRIVTANRTNPTCWKGRQQGVYGVTEEGFVLIPEGQGVVVGDSALSPLIGHALTPEGIVWLLRLHKSNAVEGMVEGRRRVVGLAYADTIDFHAIHETADRVLHLSSQYPSEARRFLNPFKEAAV